jgi:hypothetical protein
MPPINAPSRSARKNELRFSIRCEHLVDAQTAANRLRAKLFLKPSENSKEKGASLLLRALFSAFAFS